MNTTPYSECRLCPRDCGVNRLAGRTGVCRETAQCRISSAVPHFGEEPSFSGTRGSGTIFFSGCSSRCFFCQNHQISIGNEGGAVSPADLLDIGRSLIASGCHNINFVTPDHFWPHVRWLCEQLRAGGATLPFLFNSSGYQLPERVSEYAEVIDIFLPDFKFADPELARECMGDPRYPELALRALREMVERKGFLTPWDPAGETTAVRGVLVRHLILPDHAENSLEVLRLLRREFGRLLPLSVMSQFHPVPGCRERGRLTRRIHEDEHRRVVDEIGELGFQHVYVQSLAPGTEFLPDFRRDEPFEGNRRRNAGSA